MYGKLKLGFWRVNTILNSYINRVEFNELEPSLKSAKKSVSIERRLKYWNIEYNFKRNQPYLIRVSNFSRGSNSLNSVSGIILRMKRLLEDYIKLYQIYRKGYFWIFQRFTDWKKDGRIKGSKDCRINELKDYRSKRFKE